MKVLIIGGGISGLSAAYHLQKLNLPAQITLIEKEKRLGGKIETVCQNGFIIETGPESLVSYKPEAIHLCQELGLSSDIIHSIPENRKTSLYFNGKLIPLPEGIFSAFSAPAAQTVKALLKTPLLSPVGKLRMGLEPFIPAKKLEEDETAGSFFARRLGKEFFENLISPFLSGIYGGDPENLSMKSILPTFYSAEKKYGSFLKAIRANKKQKLPAEQTSPFVSLKNGLGSLVAKLSDSLINVSVEQGKIALSIRKNVKRYQVTLNTGETLEADIVLLTAPVQISGKLLKEIDPKLSDLLQEIPCSSASVITFGFNEKDLTPPLNSYGFLISRKENLPILACTLSSNKWEGRAPDGKFLMRFYANTILDDPKKITQLIFKHLDSVFKIKKDPELFLVHSHPRVMPEYRVYHQKKLEQIQTLLSNHKGLFLAGNAFQGIGISDCIQSGIKAAEQIYQFLPK